MTLVLLCLALLGAVLPYVRVIEASTGDGCLLEDCCDDAGETPGFECDDCDDEDCVPGCANCRCCNCRVPAHARAGLSAWGIHEIGSLPDLLTYSPELPSSTPPLPPPRIGA